MGGVLCVPTREVCIRVGNTGPEALLGGFSRIGGLIESIGREELETGDSKNRSAFDIGR